MFYPIPNHLDYDLHPQVSYLTSSPPECLSLSTYLQDIYLQENILAQKSFTLFEFEDLAASINNLPELEKLLTTRNIYYPQINTDQFAYAHDTYYAPAWQTFNYQFAVCDDYAMLALPFLLTLQHKDIIKNITLAEFQPIETQGDGHAIIIFEDHENKWGYVDNNLVNEPSYTSLDELLYDQNKNLHYTKTTILTRTITTLPQQALYLHNYSQGLRPTQEYVTYENEPLCK